MKKLRVFAGVCAVLLLMGCGGGDSDDPAGPGEPGMTKAALGAMLYKDTNLSNPVGQSCETCHSLLPGDGFADPDSTHTSPVSEGAVSGEFGDRNAPTAAYARFSPDFHYDTTTDRDNPRYIGGQFLDGREADLEGQAKGPFVNPKEMANTKQGVVDAVRVASYATGFKAVYGASSLDDVDTAYDLIADAIATFERTALFAPFTSKFDVCPDDQSCFSLSEKRGFDLFQIDGKGKCAECHKLEKIGGSSGVLFTDFSYWNIGVPQNSNNPAGTVATGFTDVGLAANPNLTTSSDLEKGKFKVPTLRDVEQTAPYMHNGVFATLTEVMNFYNVREIVCADPTITDTGRNDFIACWPSTLPPEVEDNLDVTFSGDLLLDEQDIIDLVAFMKTLTDGYTP
ncbi:MAG: c-type cytochrome [Gammaproteobacteria bacterium]|nr:c-type cytochrome [Gammaproteobacteria bacterium]